MMTDVIVTVSDGSLMGEKLTSIRGGSYLSFKGIPYAKPPVKELRFQEPQPPEPWDEVRPALEHGPHSVAMNFMDDNFDEKSSEDCLYLNVYTPGIPKSFISSDPNDFDDIPLRPVMFWIHGGSFTSGSGDTDVYGPDYLITEGIVLVTINYRLGPLGFLSLQNDLCPGNNALKDMIMALKWVQINILVFGGDPNNVTIFGESAGGASASYLSISPLARGLFHRVITMSGSALCPWALTSNSRECAFKLGELLGLNTDDDEELYNFLSQVPAKELIMKAHVVQESLDPRIVYMAHMPFQPVVEPDLPGAFLTEHPRVIMERGDFIDVPYLLGITSLEALLFYLSPEIPKKLKTDDQLFNMLCIGLNLSLGTPLPDQFVDDIKKYYFPDGFDTINYLKLISFALFGRPISKTSEYLKTAPFRKSSSYTYLFSRDSDKNLVKSFVPQLTLMPGACHGDELSYLFHPHKLQSPKLEPNTQDYHVVKEMTKMWTDFAKSGQIFTRDEFNSLNEDEQSYVDINTDLVVKDGFKSEEKALWDTYYNYIQ